MSSESFIFKARKYAFATFTGIVVAGTLYNIFISAPPSFDDRPEKKRKKATDGSIKPLKPEHTGPKPVENWTRKELFQFLSKNKIYADVETPIGELQKLVKQRQADIDDDNVDEIVMEASL